MSDDSILMRWMRVEIGKINEGIVSERKSLAHLLEEDMPTARTKTRNEHVFDKSVLKEISTKIPLNLQHKLRLPLVFFSDIQVPDSCYLNDPLALETLQRLGELSEMRLMQQGKLWVGRSLAYTIMKRYPTVVQIAMR